MAQSRNRRRRRGAAKAKRADLWKPVPQLEDPAPIVPAPDPGALIQSLGDPPLQGQGAAAAYTMVKVVEKAAGLATGLAHVAGLIADPEADPEVDPEVGEPA